MQFEFITTNDTKTEQYDNPFWASDPTRRVVRRNYDVGDKRTKDAERQEEQPKAITEL